MTIQQSTAIKSHNMLGFSPALWITCGRVQARTFLSSPWNSWPGSRIQPPTPLTQTPVCDLGSCAVSGGSTMHSEPPDKALTSSLGLI